MRKIFAIILVALLLGVGVVALIETDPGYVLVAHGNYTVETSLWVAALLLIIFTLLVYALLRLVYRLFGGRGSLVSWLGTRKAHHAARLTSRGQVSFAEGNWSKARRQLVRGVKHNEAPLANYLMAAHASNRLGDEVKTTEYLAAAANLESAAGSAVEITRADLQVQAGQYEQALKTLESVGADVARQPRALELRYRAYRGLDDWENLHKLLPYMKKQHTLGQESFRQLQQEVHIRLLQQSVLAADGPALDSLHSAWQGVPSDMKQDSQVLGCYVGLLLGQDAHAEAEKVILRGLKHRWDSGLVRQFGYVESDSAPRQLAQAENWLESHSEDAQLLLCLGRLSARDKLWGKARDYFERSYRLQRSAETCAELGRLLLALGEPKVAAAYFREGLLLLERRLPELPMPDKGLSNGLHLGQS